MARAYVKRKESFFIDYSLIEEYLKKEYLINNKKTLFDYFEASEFNDYKYVLYFKEITSNTEKSFTSNIFITAGSKV